MGDVAGHAGLFSTAKELGILASIILNRGGYGTIKVIDKKIIDQFIKLSNNDITFGLGWRRNGNRDKYQIFGSLASPSTIGHSGWTGTATLIDYEHRLIIILLTNKKHTSVIKEDNNARYNKFVGDDFKSSKYGNIMTLIYDAFMNNESTIN